MEKTPNKTLPTVIGEKGSPLKGIVSTSTKFMKFMSKMSDEGIKEQVEPGATTGSTPSFPDIVVLPIIYGLASMGEPSLEFPQSLERHIGTLSQVPKLIEDKDPVKPLEYIIHELRTKYFAGNTRERR